MRHFPLRELGYALGFVVLLAALYVGSYYAMVERRVAGVSFTIIMVRYRFCEEWARQFFAPVHALDQRLRPDFWDEAAFDAHRRAEGR
jgi:hypothetical protein